MVTAVSLNYSVFSANLSIHKWSVEVTHYSFRLKTDPASCGESNFVDFLARTTTIRVFFYVNLAKVKLP
jgi:hypothetical protein